MNIDLVYYDDNWAPNSNGLNFRGVRDIECGNGSGVISQAWFKIVSNWGKATYTAYADLEEGKGLKNTGQRKTQDNDDFWELPSGTRMVRIEGRRDNVNTLVACSILPLAR